MYDKFQVCTVDVHSATRILTTLERTLHYLHTLNVGHDALHTVSVMEGRLR